jgi:predicted enzyme related to lactoylglutathione lyase
MPNPFVHVELATTDLAKAKAFYGALFDWKLDDMPMGPDTYTMVGVGENAYGIGGGMMKVPMPGMPSAWLSYVAVDDVAAVVAKAKSLGAKVLKDVTPVPGYGSLAVIADPTGAVIGLWKPDNPG